MKEFFESNKKLWDQRTGIHLQSAFYNVEAFKNGANSLQPVELEEVGPVKGKKLLHLQCHFGQDTLSWARLGAEVTGVDFSEASIAAAKALAKDLKLEANFVCSNIYDLDKNLSDSFDIVFTSYGVIGWLPDLEKWAATIARFCKRGGIFYMAEFHPVVWMFDDHFEKIIYPYHNARVIEEAVEGSYADRGAAIRSTSYSWNHSLAEVINALIGSGLQLEFLHEFPWSPYNCFQNTIQGADGNYRISNLEGLIPMMYSLKARKP